MLKKFVVAALLSPAFASQAAGAWDGIYECGVNVAGQFHSVYITINGQPDGRAIFAVAAASEGQSLYGYGIGSINGGQFAGNTNFGLPFKMSPSAFGFTGTVGIVFSRVPLTATATCSKIW